MTWNIDQLRQNRKMILRIAKQHGVISLRVIGSVARREATAASDVDFIASFEEGRSLIDAGELIMVLEESLECRGDVISEKALNPSNKITVSSEAVSL